MVVGATGCWVVKFSLEKLVCGIFICNFASVEGRSRIMSMWMIISGVEWVKGVEW